MPNRFQRLDQYEHIEILGDGKIEWKRASAAEKYLLEMRVLGDTNPRFRIRADGQMELGSGAEAADVFVSRSVADRLLVAEYLQTTNALLVSYAGASGISAIQTRAGGDSVDRYIMNNLGVMTFGPGNAALDCQLSRRAADILNTPDRMEVGTLGVGNSLAATTPVNVVKKVEVFDDAGASLGFLPVYDAIN